MKALYKLTDIVRLAGHSLAVHAVRSILTSLGIIFGVCGVIAMLGITEGASYQSQVYLRELGSDKIIIRSIKPPQESKASDSSRGANVYGLTYADVRRLKSNVPNVVRTVTAHQSRKHARFGAQRRTVSVIGVEPDFTKVARVRMQRGRFLVPADSTVSPIPRGPCVLPAWLARKLFGYLDPLEQTVYIGSEPFQVVGVLSQVPQVIHGTVEGSNDCIFIPDAVRRRRLGTFSVLIERGQRQFEKVEVSQIILQMADEDSVVAGAAICRSLLDRTHPQADYLVQVPMELLEQQQKQTRLWAIVLLAIAGISLVVGGIGIMNIMLASVTERTREIGIRRALGAKQADIAVQFLVEAVTLTTVGGLIGIAVGLLAAWGVDRANMLPFKILISPWALIVPFLVAVAVGLISGLYPAIRASRLDPIQALRHE